MDTPQQPQDDPAVISAKMSQLGKVTSPQKAKAARENGKLGGWTKGRPLSEETRQKISATKRRQMLDRLFPRD